MSSAPSAIFQVADKSLGGLIAASKSIDTIRVEINRYWEKINLLISHTGTVEARAIEREIDSLIDSHERQITSFVRSVSLVYPSPYRAASNAIAETPPIPFDKTLGTKKRNRHRLSELQRIYVDVESDLCLQALEFARIKRPKRSPQSPDLVSLERALSGWIEQTNGEFHILTRTGTSVSGKSVGQTAPPKSQFISPSIVLPSHLVSHTGSKSSTILKSVSYGYGPVEVKVTIKGVAAFSLLVDGSETDLCGSVSKIICTNINEASTSNVWSSVSAGPANLMNVLTLLLSTWVEESNPSVTAMLQHLLGYMDIFKQSCCACNKWLLDDGPWGPLPPLYHVFGTPNPHARKHFTCPFPT